MAFALVDNEREKLVEVTSISFSYMAFKLLSLAKLLDEL